ncbi:hypothetical protein [Agriterribacter sp.]|uniref:hypothetical protein n=1 Tax=Agriterribacter sp. TaxID=2821509 RepID=UPI002CFA426D|nr:hypothetical protein [Agriterribacter sp.]HRO46096.1 hypothetical protein [Agriterribacter sp.]HRQ16156.1 hypothetical protein [Agriterribacter sp.]
MSEILHLIIKKAYAASLIEHLRKEEAIEIIEENVAEISEWQKDAVRKTLLHAQQNPGSLQAWDIVRQKYKTA